MDGSLPETADSFMRSAGIDCDADLIGDRVTLDRQLTARRRFWRRWIVGSVLALADMIALLAGISIAAIVVAADRLISGQSAPEFATAFLAATPIGIVVAGGLGLYGGRGPGLVERFRLRVVSVLIFFSPGEWRPHCSQTILGACSPSFSARHCWL